LRGGEKKTDEDPFSRRKLHRERGTWGKGSLLKKVEEKLPKGIFEILRGTKKKAARKNRRRKVLKKRGTAEDVRAPHPELKERVKGEELIKKKIQRKENLRGFFLADGRE